MSDDDEFEENEFPVFDYDMLDLMKVLIYNMDSKYNTNNFYVELLEDVIVKYYRSLNEEQRSQVVKSIMDVVGSGHEYSPFNHILGLIMRLDAEGYEVVN